jgi:hypothetical protein
MAEALNRAAGAAEGAQAGGAPPPSEGQPGGNKDDVIDAEYTETPKA